MGSIGNVSGSGYTCREGGGPADGDCAREAEGVDPGDCRYHARQRADQAPVPLGVTRCLQGQGPTLTLRPEDFSTGVPTEARILVVVPSTFTSSRNIDSLIEALEVRFLANRHPHLHFDLLTDCFLVIEP